MRRACSDSTAWRYTAPTSSARIDCARPRRCRFTPMSRPRIWSRRVFSMRLGVSCRSDDLRLWRRCQPQCSSSSARTTRCREQWNKPLDEESFKTHRRSNLQGTAWRHPTTPSSIWAELPMSGDCPSRTIDPRAETALLQVNTTTPHPIAGAGYLATIFLPLPKPPADSTEICRRLNELDLEQLEFAPRLGAWGLHGPDDLPGYTCFFPARNQCLDFTWR
jgi:hypothetical protein